MKNWVCYIVRCSDGSLYTGVTNNLDARILAHNEGRGAKYTKSRTPVELAACSCELTRNSAQKLEVLIKSMHPTKKIGALMRYSEPL